MNALGHARQNAPSWRRPTAIGIMELARGLPSGLAHLAAQEISGEPWVPAPHLDLITRKLVDLEQRRIRRLIIETPPRHGKSMLCSRAFPAWYLGRHPNHRVMIASEESALSSEFSESVRDILKVWGPPVFGVGVHARRTRVSDWRVANHTGRVMSAGIKTGGFTGRGANLLVIDDPIKNVEGAMSPTYRELVWNWYLSTARSRMEPNGIIIIIMTRWHQDDLVGRLLKGKEPWERVNLPAIATSENDPLGRAIGEPLWPWRMGKEELETIKNTSEYWWNCTPAPTRILMGDFTAQTIDAVAPGDSVMGFTKARRGAKRHLVRALVKRVFRTEAPVYSLVMASGRVVRCTKDHRWFTRWSSTDSSRAVYRPAGVGSSLGFVCEPDDACTPEERLLWVYLAGIVDGGGHVGRSVLVLAQGLDKNRPVYEEMLRVCRALRLSIREDVTALGGGLIVIRNVGMVYRKLIRFTNTAKRAQMVQMLTEHGVGRMQRGRDRVEAIIEGPRESVFALETTTGNYVAEGYLSSNSLYQQAPSPPGGSIAKSVWFKVVPRGTFSGRRGLKRCRFWDCASGEGQRGSDPDYTVGVRLSEHEGIFCIEHIERERYSPYDVDRLIIQTAKQDGRQVLVREEQEGGSSGVAVIDARRRSLPGFNYKGVPSHGSKIMRWMPMLLQAEAKNVVIEDGLWVQPFFEEVNAVPYGAHDDQLDSSAGAFLEIAGKIVSAIPGLTW